MFADINARLVAIQGERRKKEKYDSQLADYQKELETIEKTVSGLRDQFKAEKKDVDKLEHLSLANLFASISGKKEEKLSQEKKELIAAEHKLKEAEKTKREIELAMLELENMLQSFRNLEKDYEQLLLEKEAMIKRSNSPFAAKIFELSEQEGMLKSYITELDEAIDTGARVKRVLSDAIESLEEAEGWGTWDVLGGGTMSDFFKHQEIDQAEEYLHQAQTYMRYFQKELLDIENIELLEINISEMLKFADFFFDGFIVDLMVKEKINQSLTRTQENYDEVTEILLKLEEQRTEKAKELEGIEKEKQEFVESL